ncbi:hypothetical protein CHARACLAT_027285 [Characodon lateralis]|uniref:Uncharacterized protein n=1 Tax=Characodon lateralis TaxID=208331 RepID=A0ABU7EPE5_9TELE|nr:hypothetical protein [Characodon lateralis]
MDYAAETLLAHLEFFNDSLFHNNFSGGYNETDALLPTGVKVTIVVVYMIVCVIGLVGNFLVMYVIIRFSEIAQRSFTHLLNKLLLCSPDFHGHSSLQV